MASVLGEASLVHSPSLYHGKTYRSPFPRTNRYQCQTEQPGAAGPAAAGFQETLLCFHCKHKTTVTHQVKSLITAS